MKINSPAGNFIITFETLEPIDGNIQITGNFGAWDAKAQMSLSEFFGILRMAMTMKMIGFLARSMLPAGSTKREEPK
jgi:hypothetical protein